MKFILSKDTHTRVVDRPDASIFGRHGGHIGDCVARSDDFMCFQYWPEDDTEYDTMMINNQKCYTVVHHLYEIALICLDMHEHDVQDALSKFVCDARKSI